MQVELNRGVLDNIILYGDPHGNFSDINQIIKERNPIAIFILGDLEYGVGEPLVNNSDTKIYAISGNHDTGLMFDGVEFIDWTVVTVYGIRFLGLGNYPSGEMKVLMESQKDIDVLLCHYPLGACDRDVKNCPIIDVYTKTGAYIYFHGHFHSSIFTLLNGAYAGKRTGYTCDIESHPSVNTTNSAITLALERLEPPAIEWCGWAAEYVIYADKEKMTKKERDKSYHRIYAASRVEQHKHVIKCLKETQEKVINGILRNKKKYINGPLKGRPVKALKLRHTREWILIGENNQITTTTVATSRLNGVMNNKSLFDDYYWKTQTSKERFNSVYLIELNEKVSNKLAEYINQKVS